VHGRPRAVGSEPQTRVSVAVARKPNQWRLKTTDTGNRLYDDGTADYGLRYLAK